MMIKNFFLSCFIILILNTNSFSFECIKGNCQDGYGVVINSDGYRYEGHFKNGGRHGNGLNILPDGNKYIGEWYDNAPYGKRIMILSDGSKYISLNDGSSNFGISIINGTKFVGGVKDNGPDGPIIAFPPDGSVFELIFKNGEPVE